MNGTNTDNIVGPSSTVSEEMVRLAKTEDPWHFAANLNAMMRLGYCRRCGLVPSGCMREGCGASENGARELLCALESQSLELCHEIEKIGASTEQTNASVKSSDLHRAIQKASMELDKQKAPPPVSDWVHKQCVQMSGKIGEDPYIGVVRNARLLGWIAGTRYTLPWDGFARSVITELDIKISRKAAADAGFIFSDFRDVPDFEQTSYVVKLARRLEDFISNDNSNDNKRKISEVAGNYGLTPETVYVFLAMACII